MRPNLKNTPPFHGLSEKQTALNEDYSKFGQ